METTGQRIERLRKERGWSQGELSRSSGLHYATVSLIERGLRNPTPRTVRDLAEALNVTQAQLLGGK